MQCFSDHVFSTSLLAHAFKTEQGHVACLPSRSQALGIADHLYSDSRPSWHGQDARSQVALSLDIQVVRVSRAWPILASGVCSDHEDVVKDPGPFTSAGDF